MEKKNESTTFNHLSMCEKLFKAFNPAFRSFRRLTVHHQVPEGTTNPSSTRPNHSLDSGMKDSGPQKALPTSVQLIRPSSTEKKPAEAVAPKTEQHYPLPTPVPPPPPPPPPPSASVAVRKVPNKAVPSPAPPKVGLIPQPVPPTAVATRQQLQTPVPPAGAPAVPEVSKKNINERVEDYINRVKAKMRTVSRVGRPPS